MQSLKRQVWFITGAARGMGLDIAKAALDAGHAVVATGRNPEKVAAAIGGRENALTLKLDITSPEEAKTQRAPRPSDSAESTSW